MNTERLFNVRVASRLRAEHVFQVNNVIATEEGLAILWARQMCADIGIDVRFFTFSVIRDQSIIDTEPLCREYNGQHQLNLQ